MRLVFALALLSVLGGVTAAGAQESSAPPASDAASAVDVGPALDLIAQAQSVVAAIDLLIEQQDAQLEDLYRQRDAASAAAQSERVAQLGGVIDRTTITLDGLEAERAAIEALITTTQAQVETLLAQTPNDPAPTKD
jgi:hypothetical protein